MLLEKVKEIEIVRTLAPILEAFRLNRPPGERFGDFCNRMGMEALRELTRVDKKEKPDERE